MEHIRCDRPASTGSAAPEQSGAEQSETQEEAAGARKSLGISPAPPREPRSRPASSTGQHGTAQDSTGEDRTGETRPVQTRPNQTRHTPDQFSPHNGARQASRSGDNAWMDIVTVQCDMSQLYCRCAVLYTESHGFEGPGRYKSI